MMHNCKRWLAMTTHCNMQLYGMYALPRINVHAVAASSLSQIESRSRTLGPRNLASIAGTILPFEDLY